MKVIVGFNEVKVLVPCGDGQMSVKELTEKAVLRYLKASNRSDAGNIQVQRLTVANFGGILDPDDVLSDVVDDKEQLVAHFIDLADGKHEETSTGKSTPSSNNSSARLSVSHKPVEAPIPAPVKLDASADQESVDAGHKDDTRPVSEPLSSASADLSLKPLVTEVPENQITSESLSTSHSKDTHEQTNTKPTNGFDRSLAGRRSLDNLSNDSASWLLGQERVGVGKAALGLSDDLKARVRHVTIENNGRQLGIQVVPYYDEAHHAELGFEIDAIVEGKRVHAENLMSVGDRIVAINGRPLAGLPYETAQDIFCKALRLPVLELDVLNKAADTDQKPVEKEEAAAPVPVPVAVAVPVSAEEVKKQDTRHCVELLKTADSLGFSLTSGESDGSGESFVHVRNILAGGIAQRDGRLRIGDRILEINDVDVVHSDQLHVVSLLRAAPVNSIVKLLVSRPARDEPKTPIPTAEVLKFDVPLGGGLENIGLGANVKARCLQIDQDAGGSSRDLGVFVNGFVEGGAAQRDGRLRVDDRIIEVNGLSLLSRSNADAMATLRKAMAENAQRTVCALTVIRTSNTSETFKNSSSNSHQRDKSVASEDVVDSRAAVDASVTAPVLLIGGNGNESRDLLAKVAENADDKRHRLQSQTSQAQHNTDAKSRSELPPNHHSASVTAKELAVIDGDLFSQHNRNESIDAQQQLDGRNQARDFSAYFGNGIVQPPESAQAQAPLLQVQVQATAAAIAPPAPAAVSNKVSVGSLPIAPLDLEPDSAIHLAKIRGSTESFRLAVDRSHDSHSKPDKKAEKAKKSSKADKADKQKTAELNGTSSGHSKKKKHSEGSSLPSATAAAQVQGDQLPGPSAGPLTAPPALSPPQFTAQVATQPVRTDPAPPQQQPQQQPRPVAATGPNTTGLPPNANANSRPASMAFGASAGAGASVGVGVNVRLPAGAPGPFGYRPPVAQPQNQPPGAVAVAIARPSLPASRPPMNANRMSMPASSGMPQPQPQAVRPATGQAGVQLNYRPPAIDARAPPYANPTSVDNRRSNVPTVTATQPLR